MELSFVACNCGVEEEKRMSKNSEENVPKQVEVRQSQVELK